MKRTTWRKHHKWLGILLCFFMLMFCLSGIVLNHRATFSGVNVGRELLPGWYRYRAWNGGLLRGTTPYVAKDSSIGVLVYGAGGIWQTDSAASSFSDFNRGLPAGADHRQIRNVAQAANKELFAASIFALYRYGGKDIGWQAVDLPKDDDELLADVVSQGDTLVVVGRSHLYLATAPYTHFRKIQPKAPDGYRREVSLFRTVWMLHSGELFGTAGRIVADAVAVILMVLCITGMAYWLLPRYMRRKRSRGAGAPTALHMTRLSYLWHDRIGRATIVLTLFIAMTGWCLRPPVMIPLALTRVAAVPGTSLHSPNPWHDKLRVVRYDDTNGDWLLSTSDGFYSLKNLDGVPAKIGHAPAVSVMGLNVLQKDHSGRWLCGSFSGMFVWDRQRHAVVDYFTHEPAADVAGPPFGKRAISGYSQDLADSAFAVEYYKGTSAMAQPAELDTLPMSLWNVALEVHNGRIYMGSAATYIFVFLAGIGIVWCLWSGWKLRKRVRGRVA